MKEGHLRVVRLSVRSKVNKKDVGSEVGSERHIEEVRSERHKENHVVKVFGTLRRLNSPKYDNLFVQEVSRKDLLGYVRTEPL